MIDLNRRRVDSVLGAAIPDYTQMETKSRVELELIP